MPALRLLQYMNLHWDFDICFDLKYCHLLNDKPQKKQNEYAQRGLLRGTGGSLKLRKVHNMGNLGHAYHQEMGILRESMPRDCENANGECEEETKGYQAKTEAPCSGLQMKKLNKRS
ncbi:hypothetical protein EDD16DRAFT_1523255 [Pisolithus croceorrhizus]|nr:hypothetical protein EDD16DRAFT_1523255 [Pisolithus croceorrhizus]